MLMYSPKTHSEIKACVEKFGWERTKEAINAAVKAKADFPPSYARGILRKQESEAVAKPDKVKTPPKLAKAVMNHD